ncbi:DUF6207 family protein [Streptomyces naphthomycinicus]|uniref:DUF6207 family protein n=1 Tax=Streptomyces naphthomycinicus TaxID=2872625 RepID=UPI00288AA476|nr:DUF6207 family protein [Streptomyces sp. TML10]
MTHTGRPDRGHRAPLDHDSTRVAAGPPLPGRENSCGRLHVLLCVRTIRDAHVAMPGLAVVEVAAADDETAFAVQEMLAARNAIAPADRTTREPGEPGVRLRCFLNLHQDPDT